MRVYACYTFVYVSMSMSIHKHIIHILFMDDCVSIGFNAITKLRMKYSWTYGKWFFSFVDTLTKWNRW